MVKNFTVELSTKGMSDMHDITGKVSDAVRKSGVTDGIVVVFAPGSTAGITTVEFEPGLQKDIPQAFEKLFPYKAHYEHNATWGDGNGASHVRASLLGPSLSVPLVKGEMTLGTWQQIVLIDFDTRPRKREVVVQVIS